MFFWYILYINKYVKPKFAQENEMKNQKFCAHVRFFKGYDLFRIKSVYRFQVNILVIRWCYFYFRSGKSRILVSEVCKIPKSETET